MKKSEILTEAFQHFMKLPYPGECRGLDVYGIDLVLLDAGITEAVKKIAEGNRDPYVLNLLGSLELHARMVLLALENNAYSYFDQARKLAQMALNFVPVERDKVVRLVEAVITENCPDLNMISFYADVINMRAFGRDTALTTASRLGREVWCRLLLEAGAVSLLANGIDQTPFILAVLSGQVAILRILVESGVDPNVQSLGNVPALGWATYQAHEPVVAFLLEQGADPWASSNGKDPLEFAIQNGLLDIARLIAKARGL